MFHICIVCLNGYNIIINVWIVICDFDNLFISNHSFNIQQINNKINHLDKVSFCNSSINYLYYLSASYYSYYWNSNS